MEMPPIHIFNIDTMIRTVRFSDATAGIVRTSGLYRFVCVAQVLARADERHCVRPADDDARRLWTHPRC